MICDVLHGEMMTRCTSTLLILVTLCAAGCGSSLDAKHDAIQKGMTKVEVEAILGAGKLDKQIEPYCWTCRKWIKYSGFLAPGEIPPACPKCGAQGAPEEWWWYFGRNQNPGMGASLIQIHFTTNGTVRYKELSDL